MTFYSGPWPVSNLSLSSDSKRDNRDSMMGDPAIIIGENLLDNRLVFCAICLLGARWRGLVLSNQVPRNGTGTEVIVVIS